MAAHAEACHSIGVNLTPLVLETLGGKSHHRSNRPPRVSVSQATPTSCETNNASRGWTVSRAPFCHYLLHHVPHQFCTVISIDLQTQTRGHFSS